MSKNQYEFFTINSCLNSSNGDCNKLPKSLSQKSYILDNLNKKTIIFDSPLNKKCSYTRHFTQNNYNINKDDEPIENSYDLTNYAGIHHKICQHKKEEEIELLASPFVNKNYRYFPPSSVSWTSNFPEEDDFSYKPKNERKIPEYLTDDIIDTCNTCIKPFSK